MGTRLGISRAGEMGTQVALCRFRDQLYRDKIRPALQSILMGQWPSWVLERYKSYRDFPGASRTCPKSRFRDCVCFSADLQLQEPAPCLGYRDWHDSRLLRLYEKMLLDDCIVEVRWLPKQLLYLDKIYAEEFASLGLGGDSFQLLLRHLCDRWAGTWIDVDNAGVGGYLTLGETTEFSGQLSCALAKVQPSQHDEWMASFLDDLAELNDWVGKAVVAGNGLLWVHDLVSQYYR